MNLDLDAIEARREAALAALHKWPVVGHLGDEPMYDVSFGDVLAMETMVTALNSSADVDDLIAEVRMLREWCENARAREMDERASRVAAEEARAEAEEDVRRLRELVTGAELNRVREVYEDGSLRHVLAKDSPAVTISHSLHVGGYKMNVTTQTYSVDEGARILGISKATLQRHIYAGQVPAIKLGRRLLIPRAYLDGLFAGARGTADEAVPCEL